MTEQERDEKIRQFKAASRERSKEFHALIHDALENAIELLSRPLGSKTALRKQFGLKRKSTPRKWTPEVEGEAIRLYSNFHNRVKVAKKTYTRNRRSSSWQELVALEDKALHRGQLEMPSSVIAGFALKSPSELAEEWAAAQLNRKHESLNVTPGRLHKILKQSRRKR
jgi:hypothetical protein